MNQRPFPVPRYILEVVATPPKRWTIVATPTRAGNVPRAHTPQYAVCPSCRERVPVSHQTRAMPCPRCRGDFEVAWNEDYLSTY